MHQILRYVRRHHIALVALFIALGGTSYAAVSLPRNSVGSAQIKSRSVTSAKVADKAITRAKVRNNAIDSAKVADGSLRAADFAAGELPAGPAGPAGAAGPAGPAGATGATGPAGPAEGPAGGALTGNYPNPDLADGAVDAAKIADGAVGAAKLGQLPTVRLIRGSGTTLSVASGATQATIPWPAPTGTRPYDIGGFFSADNNQISQCATDICIKFPRTGTYVLSAGVRWADPSLAGTQDNGTGYRSLRINGLNGRISGGTTTPAMNGTPTLQSLTTIDRFEAGTAAFVNVAQNSGTDLNVAGSLEQVYFAATWVAP